MPDTYFSFCRDLGNLAIACLVFSMGINTEQNIPNILFKFDNNKS
jgi:hypothetical protein